MAKRDPRKIIVNKLDKIVSEIVLLRDKHCVVCKSDKQLGAGHIFSRRTFSTRWDVSEGGNVHCQCWSCNYRHIRDQYDYFQWYINEFGQHNFEELRIRYKTVIKYKIFQLEEMYERLKDFRNTFAELRGGD